jgi:hypothetical protein
MKKIFGIVMALAIGVTAVAGAQQMGLFRNPVFVAQPGIVKPFAEGASSEFNARFVTAIPTSIARTTLVAIVQWTPFADNGVGGKANAPAFVYGPVFNVADQRAFSFDVDALFAYAPGCVDSTSDYCHKFLVEGDLFIKLGNMMTMSGHWRSLALYALLAYQITEVPDGAESKDRMALLAGLSLPLAPWRN